MYKGAFLRSPLSLRSPPLSTSPARSPPKAGHGMNGHSASCIFWGLGYAPASWGSLGLQGESQGPGSTPPTLALPPASSMSLHECTGPVQHKQERQRESGLWFVARGKLALLRKSRGHGPSTCKSVRQGNYCRCSILHAPYVLHNSH